MTYEVSADTQKAINDIILDAYNHGRASFERDLAASGKVVVDRELLERLSRLDGMMYSDVSTVATLLANSAATELAGETQEWGMT